MATDASKTSSFTSLGIWDVLLQMGFSSNVYPMNSIFTSEELALFHPLTLLPHKANLFFFSDSCSVISSLQNLSFHSPNVVMTLHSTLQPFANRLSGIHIIWGGGGLKSCEDHPNEMADAMTRHFVCPRLPTPWLASEDICFHLQCLHFQEDTVDWLTEKYCRDFLHLTKCS